MARLTRAAGSGLFPNVNLPDSTVSSAFVSIRVAVSRSPANQRCNTLGDDWPRCRSRDTQRHGRRLGFRFSIHDTIASLNDSTRAIFGKPEWLREGALLRQGIGKTRLAGIVF